MRRESKALFGTPKQVVEDRRHAEKQLFGDKEVSETSSEKEDDSWGGGEQEQPMKQLF